MATVQKGQAYIVGFSSGFEETWTFEKIDKKSEATIENNLGETNETENVTITNHKWSIDFTAVIHEGGADNLKTGDVITVLDTQYLLTNIVYGESKGKRMVNGSMESFDSMDYT